MSRFLKMLGGTGKSGKAPTTQEAIQRLKETEEMLIKKQEFLEKKIEQEVVTAKKNGMKNKRGEEKERESPPECGELSSFVVSRRLAEKLPLVKQPRRPPLPTHTRLHVF